jgi:hypothetical protein
MPAIRIFRRLRDLLDVTFGTPADGDVVTYDTGTGKFVMAAPAGGGTDVPFVGDSAPSSPTDGELWWDTDDATPASGSSQTFSGAYAYRTSNQTIVKGSLGTAIVFDSSLYDTDNYLIADTDPDHPGEFLIPSDGLYRICAFLLFDDTTDDSPAVGVEVDEDGLALGPQSANYLPVWFPANPHSLGYTDVTVMYGPMPLLAGSHVQIRGLTNDSVDGQVLGSITQSDTIWATIQRIADLP